MKRVMIQPRRPSAALLAASKSRLAVVLFAFALFAGGAVFGQAVQAPYSEGSVWELTSVRTKYGMGDDYLKSLADKWKPTLEELKRQGVVQSYRILSASPVDRTDWDLMLMVEYKNMAALDGLDDKFRAIEAKMIGNEDAQRKLYSKRGEIREILGSKIAREITLK